jgi:hypothetical protein
VSIEASRKITIEMIREERQKQCEGWIEEFKTCVGLGSWIVKSSGHVIVSVKRGFERCDV